MTTAEESCRELIRRVAGAFRLGMEADGNAAFVSFVDCYIPLLDKIPPQRAQVAQPLLQKIFTAQQNRDYLYLADLLEYGGLPF